MDIEYTSASGIRALDLPTRSDDALSGTDFGNSIINLSATQERDDAFFSDIMSGNVPSNTRSFAQITINGGGNTLSYYCSRDYLAVGNDEDYLRVSINGRTAKRIADQLNCILPTRKMVMDQWISADLKISPRPILATPNMISTSTLIEHNNAVNGQIGGREFSLVSGIKKDIVIAKHLLQDHSRIGIFGWVNKLTGKAIQDLNTTSHDISYCDYSQSCRLISRNAILNDQSVDLYDILQSNQYSYLISDEGPYNPESIYT